ncbi:RNA methyltransferase [uncultured Rhodoblastus sp.]|uniref:RNA methyltransferase n=1 Tax=uncultured Rhodoblastus sp. TaxID=543037 RepID=UPI0025D50B73|nr:RNA methyltransferase [uncultured Rhodoblastus sp.]
MVGAGTDRTKPLFEGGPAIVLVRPQLAVNIGMCARAMANFGLSDLRLVSPREGWPRTGARRKGAYAAAAGAVHLLENAKVFDSVAEAVADLNFVWATTARERGQHKRIEIPEIAMAESAAAIMAGEKQGILFGPERTGLDNDDIALASAILTFPVNPAYGSLNLAQAVLLCGYEFFKSRQGGGAPFDLSERSPPAQRAMTLSFFEFLEEKLDAAGFFRPATKRPVMQRNMRNMLHRMNLSQQDVRTLWGAIVRLVEGPREKPQTRKRIRQPKAAQALEDSLLTPCPRERGEGPGD